ncbi:hypothetical protein IFM89_007133 [Coptis chinensis]|uniref:HECT domain-containing protein n=1 Tax=Coptis chinensis TaxID=261450 RepID=A0A835LII5_9MAGN|nr:hypothetical protein IFM89_007133 [Coptis chinensis]
MVNLSTKNNSCEEESLTLILGQIMEELNGEEPLSNFEFIQSGLVTSLVDYLSNGCYRTKKVDPCDLPSHLDVVQKRFEVFSRFCLSSTSHHRKDMPLAILMEKLQRAASSLETFPVISHAFEPEENYATIPSGRPTTHPCLEVCFTKVEGEAALCDYSSDAVHVEAFTSIEAIERYMWPEVSTSRSKHDEELATESKEQPESSAPEVSVSASTSGLECSLGEHLTPSIESDIQQLIFYLDGEQLDRSLTLYQAVLQLEMKKENDLVDGPSFWDRQYKIAYGKATEQKEIHIPTDHPRNNLCISSMLFGEPPSSFEKSSPIYEILILLKILEVVTKAASHVASHERSNASADGQNNSLDNMLVTGCRVPQTEFVSIKLTEKLEQQMQESLIVSAGSMPSWWMQLMEAFPFLFSFEARSKYFQRTSHGSFEVQAHSEDNSNGRQLHISVLARKKFKVCRSRILESAAEIMSSRKCHEAILEVEYSEEVGTGLGPTMEFFTLVSQEFQKVGLGMWREDHGLLTSGDSLEVENSGFVMAPWGLFPRPWSAASSTSNETQFSEVISKFILLGQVVAKALQDGRVLDLSLSKSFYKLILEQDLNMYDICSFDPALGRTLVEFQALVGGEKVLDPVSGKMTSDPYFRNTSIEDLCLDFTLPGYCDYMLTSVVQDQKMLMRLISYYVEIRVLGRAMNFVDNIKFNHGYTESSPPIINLLEIIQEFDCKQQRAFLQFVTGAPRLPPGGLAALNPKLTVVCKHCDGQVDGDLPSVMTCANYLKLPPYTSKDTMRERLIGDKVHGTDKNIGGRELLLHSQKEAPPTPLTKFELAWLQSAMDRTDKNIDGKLLVHSPKEVPPSSTK